MEALLFGSPYIGIPEMFPFSTILDFFLFYRRKFRKHIGICRNKKGKSINIKFLATLSIFPPGFYFIPFTFTDFFFWQ